MSFSLENALKHILVLNQSNWSLYKKNNLTIKTAIYGAFYIDFKSGKYFFLIEVL